MSPCESINAFSRLAPHNSETGQKRIKLIMSGHQGELDFTNYPQRSAHKKNACLLRMHEFLHTNSEEILSDKGIFWLNAAPTMRLSQTLDPGSTGNAPVSSPFWKEHSEELSRRLSLQVVTDYAGLPLSSLNTCSKTVDASSQSSTLTTIHQSRSSLTTLCPSFRSSVAGVTASANTQKSHLRMVKIKLNPTQWQKKVLHLFNSQCRFTYNQALVARRGGEAKLNFITLRNMLVTHKSTERDNKGPDASKKSRKPLEIDGEAVKPSVNSFVEDRDWLLYTPVSLRQGAVKQYVAAEKAAHENRRQGNIESFAMQFRKKRLERSWTLAVDKRQISFDGKHLVILSSSLCSENGESGGKNSKRYKPDIEEREKYYRRPKKQPFKELPSETSIRFFEKPPFRGTPPHDCSIHYDQGQFYLQVPIDKTFKARPLGKCNQPVIGLDPGGRDFLVGFDTIGTAKVLGRSQVDKLVAISKRQSVIQSLLETGDKRTRKRLLLQRRKAYHQYYNIKKDFHFQLATFLAKKHSTVFLPKLDHEWIKGTLTPKAVDRFQISGHGLFMDRLKQKCFEHGTWLPEVDERYTTKCCSCCGKLHWGIGSSKVFACPFCPNIMDRDVNAAKNILDCAFPDMYFKKGRNCPIEAPMALA